MIAQAVFLQIRVIGVTGAKLVHDVAVILRALILVVNDQRDGRAGGFALEHAGENFHFIIFAPLRSVTRGTRFASIEVILQVGGRQGHARRTTIDDAADGRAVAFAE